jgi:DNA-binding NtrC family response regulator
MPLAAPPKTLLVVDDDEAFLSAAAKHLAGAGFSVIAAPDALQALEKIGWITALHCMVLNVYLPTGTPHGIALAGMVRSRFPGVPTIFISADQDAVQFVNSHDGKLFFKPADLEAITAEIHAVTD